MYVAARKHNAYERDIDKLKKFLVYILVSDSLFITLHHAVNNLPLFPIL